MGIDLDKLPHIRGFELPPPSGGGERARALLSTPPLPDWAELFQQTLQAEYADLIELSPTFEGTQLLFAIDGLPARLVCTRLRELVTRVSLVYLVRNGPYGGPP
jgi:hypothetical protein